jgi:hypothetical protein
LDVSAEISHLTNNGDNMDADGEQGCRPPSAYHRPQRTGVRSCKYLNNVVQQDLPDKAANPADARTQAIRDGGRDDSQHSKWQRKSKNNSSTSNQ